MGTIQVLDQQTIDKIAAGEVIERPSSVVKELVENAIDAGATAVAVEIKEGGTTFIRVTDNGSGIPAEQVPVAFLRHSTSKIRSAEDLLSVASLGFRGEALSSIAAVSMVELITKTREELAGTRYCIEGGVEKELEETAAPEGTTFLIRSLFYNTPARRKFLRSPMTEGGYIGDLMERMALSRPDISFRFISNGQTKLHTAGNHNLKDVIYQVYGRDIAANLIEIDREEGPVRLTGFIGKPLIGRGNRNFETYFVNGRYVKSGLIAKGIEEAYKTLLMQHKYPFTVLHFSVDGRFLDVNVHPTKMELRFFDREMICSFVQETLRGALLGRELIPRVSLGPEEKSAAQSAGSQRPAGQAAQSAGAQRPAGQTAQNVDAQALGELARAGRGADGKLAIRESSRYGGSRAGSPSQGSQQAGSPSRGDRQTGNSWQGGSRAGSPSQERSRAGSISQGKGYGGERSLEYFLEEMKKRVAKDHEKIPAKSGAEAETADRAKTEDSPADNIISVTPRQMELFETQLLDPRKKADIRIIGQLFDTYWLVQLEDMFYMIDQHAAHEKVLFEGMMEDWRKKEILSQMVSPPLIVSLNLAELEILQTYGDAFASLGFELAPFGGKEYAISAVPANLYGIAEQELFLEMLDSLADEGLAGKKDSQLVLEKIASMSCKAAVKGNQRLGRPEAEKLIEKLFTLENPYTCPHGRPTVISMTRQEIERKFKRIV